MKLFDRITALLYPPKCVVCGRVLAAQETDLCHRCRIEAPVCPEFRTKRQFLTGWTALWYYEGLVRRSLLRFKFYGKRSYAAVYGRLLAMKIARELPEDLDVVTWVPISRWRRFRRGYDQSELIARAVAAELGMECLTLVRKIRNNRPQSRIKGQAQRRANVLGAYVTVDQEKLAGKRILLLDDIITTGATAGECARVLLTAGAKDVYCAAVAAARSQKKK